MMEMFFESFPHIAENIFRFMDKEALKNCYEASTNWRNFLTKQTFFLAGLTRGHSGWDEILGENDSEMNSFFSESFIKVDAEVSKLPFDKQLAYGEIHPIFCAIYSKNLELFKRIATSYHKVPDRTIQYWNWQDIYEDMDKDFWKNCYKISINWRNFLKKQTFFLAKLTDDHPEWDRLMRWSSEMNSVLSESFIKMEEEIEEFMPEASRSAFKNIHPIFCAIYSGNLEIFKQVTTMYPQFKKLKIQILVPLFFEERVYPTSFSPFHFAAKIGKSSIVKFFIDFTDSGENNPKDSKGFTPLHWASKYGHLETVKILLDKVQEKNPKSELWQTPLHLAASNGHLEVVRILLDTIEEKNPQDASGLTPLNYSQDNEMRKLIKSYLE